VRRLALLAVAVLLSACTGATVLSPPPPDLSEGWTPVAVRTRTVGLGLPGGVHLARGVRFAGGLELMTPHGDRFHSLSDLKLAGDDLVMVSDAGDLFRARLSLDRRGRPSGLAGARMHPLTAADGRPFPTKTDGDAEGLAVTPDGELLVAFEGRHRIWRYGPLAAPAAVPTPVSTPPITAPGNVGLEALAMAPGGWRAAGEGGGIWDCTPAACAVVVAAPAAPIPESEWRDTGLDRDPGGDGWFLVQRLYRAPVDMRARIRRMDAAGALGPVLVELTLPSTTDNFEGIAAVARPDATRLYILSDDNDNRKQRTLLLAFDVAGRD